MESVENKEIEVDPITQEGIRRMRFHQASFNDFDGYKAKGGKVWNKDERIDLPVFLDKSPDTIHMLLREAILIVHGYPQVTISGKSGTIRYYYDELTRKVVSTLIGYGMVKPSAAKKMDSPYPRIDPDDVHPDFLEPRTGKIIARLPNGKKSQRLVLSAAGFDNGSALWELLYKDHFYEAGQFPPLFFKLFGDTKFQELLSKSTRANKFERQSIIMPKHVVLAGEKPYGGFSKLMADERYESEWRPVAKLAQAHSYPSGHGTKFNAELAMGLRNNPELLAEWNEYLFNVMNGNSEAVYDVFTLERNLKNLFSKCAMVSTNFVEDAKIGDRVVLDFHTADKWDAELRFIKLFSEIYDESGMVVPNFLNGSVGGGDGPHKNDDRLICREQGITNYYGPHLKVRGFPGEIRNILKAFHVTVRDPKNNPLRDTEETLVWYQLLLHARLGYAKDDLPEETKAKLMFY